MSFNDIQLILLSDWDPLNVGDNHNLSDEYDAYIPELLRLVNSNSDYGTVERYLRKVEIDLGIHPPFEKRVQTARRLTRRD